MVNAFGSNTPYQSLPINYYAPLSQRATIDNGYNIGAQTQYVTNPYTHYPDHHNHHDPHMTFHRDVAQQRARQAIAQIQGQAYPMPPSQNMMMNPYAQSSPSQFIVPNNVQAISAFVMNMMPHLAGINSGMPHNLSGIPWQTAAQHPVAQDIRYDILNHLAKGTVHIHIDPEPEEPTPAMDPVAIHENAQIWGDPHFVGADGGKFDLHGEAGNIYNILSDRNLQLNAEFIDWPNGTTVIGRSGITIGEDQIEIYKDGSFSVNGTTYTDNGIYLDDIIEKADNRVFVRSGEYDLEFLTKGSHMDIHFDSENVVKDNILPQGLWGGTVDGDGIAREGDKGTNAQGGGGILKLDGTIAPAGDTETVKLYELDNLFNTDFENFNRFNS